MMRRMGKNKNAYFIQTADLGAATRLRSMGFQELKNNDPDIYCFLNKKGASRKFSEEEDKKLIYTNVMTL